jgi:tRNA dimethylallyltransferase
MNQKNDKAPSSHTVPSSLLVVVLGPTAVGKTAATVQLATHFSTEIISADSRQFYRELTIGAAIPSPKEQAGIQHHFLADRSITEPLDAGTYGRAALQCINTLFRSYNIVVLVGGSGLYIDAVIHGFDDLPEADATLRASLNARLQTEGIAALQNELQQLDPAYYAQADINNPKRLIRALEVCLVSGRSYSELRKKSSISHSFNIAKIGLELPREVLYARINRRTEQMMEAGFEAEARAVYSYRHLQALQTVGYRELFDYFDKKTDFKTAVKRIQQHTRNYAKRQLTWWRRDTTIEWFEPENHLGMINHIEEKLNN